SATTANCGLAASRSSKSPKVMRSPNVGRVRTVAAATGVLADGTEGVMADGIAVAVGAITVAADELRRSEQGSHVPPNGARQRRSSRYRAHPVGAVDIRWRLDLCR